ncbi:MAG: ABC transporter permease [Pacificimonas sp.]
MSAARAPGFVSAMLTIARRDIVATVMSKGFLIWLGMPILGLIFGIVASLVQGDPDPERAPTAVAVIDGSGNFADRLSDTAALERARTRYARYQSRYRSIRGGELPPALDRPAAMLTYTELEGLRETLDDIEEEYDLGTGVIGHALGPRDNSPRFTTVPGRADPQATATELLAREGGRFGAVIVATGDDIRLYKRPGSNADRARALASNAWQRDALERAGLTRPLDELNAAAPPIPVVPVENEVPDANQPGPSGGEQALATGAAVVLFMLISLLAGALLSNMVEEKGNKVIEILVASVPIPAIFAGKLLGMLVVSMIGVTVWGAVFGGGAAFVLGQLPDGILPDPARGWGPFAALVLMYFVTAYLIYGAIYLGIGSLCTSIREVQTLSMPVTILQMVVLIGTLGAISNPDGVGAAIAAIFPLSAPYMMGARAAVGTEIGIHIAALAWQFGFAAVIIFISARLFRYGVLRSGPPPSVKGLFGSAKFWVRGKAAG